MQDLTIRIPHVGYARLSLSVDGAAIGAVPAATNAVPGVKASATMEHKARTPQPAEKGQACVGELQPSMMSDDGHGGLDAAQAPLGAERRTQGVYDTAGQASLAAGRAEHARSGRTVRAAEGMSLGEAVSEAGKGGGIESDTRRTALRQREEIAPREAEAVAVSAARADAEAATAAAAHKEAELRAQAEARVKAQREAEAAAQSEAEAAAEREAKAAAQREAEAAAMAAASREAAAAAAMTSTTASAQGSAPSAASFDAARPSASTAIEVERAASVGGGDLVDSVACDAADSGHVGANIGANGGTNRRSEGSTAGWRRERAGTNESSNGVASSLSSERGHASRVLRGEGEAALRGVAHAAWDEE
eukprot:6176796-Pleurochrysis_carterae.AAC.1